MEIYQKFISRLKKSGYNDLDLNLDLKSGYNDLDFNLDLKSGYKDLDINLDINTKNLYPVFF